MGGVIHVEPGGEIYIPYAKKKLRELHDYMLSAGIGSFNKRIDVSDGSAIYLKSLHVGNEVFADKIRITGSQMKYISSAALVVDDPIPTRSFDIPSPAIIFTGYAGVGQTAWIQQASPAPTYATVSYQFSWRNSAGVTITETLSSASSSSGIGADLTISGLDSGSGRTYIAADWGVGDLGFVIDTYLGYTRWAQTKILRFIYAEEVPSGVSGAYTVALATWRAAYNAFYAAYYADSFSALVSQIQNGGLRTEVADKIKDAHPTVTWTDDEGIEQTSTVRDGETVDIFYVNHISDLGEWGPFKDPPYTPARDHTTWSGEFKYLGRLRYDIHTDTFMPAKGTTKFKNPERDGTVAAYQWSDLPGVTKLALYPQVYDEVGGDNLWLVWTPKVEVDGVPAGQSRPENVYTPQMVDIHDTLGEWPPTDSDTVTPTVLIAAATPQPPQFRVPVPPED